jgi:hypothetical protein
MFVSKPVLARHLGVCSKSVDNWVERGWLPEPTRGPNGRQRWDASVLRPERTADLVDLGDLAASMESGGEI